MPKSSSQFYIQPGGSLRGEIRVPGDKSISHRAVMLGAIAEGDTRIVGFLQGEDCLATLNAFRAMGVPIDELDARRVIIHGVGKRGLRRPDGPLNLGNSGTSMRLLAGLLCGQGFDVTLSGDASLSRRPMGRVTEPLAQMGANILPAPGGTPPIRIMASSVLKGIRYDMPVASAQVKSSLLLAGLNAQGTTCVREPAPTRDHTERMLRALGYPVARRDAWVCLTGDDHLKGTLIEVPGDISSAAFFMVGASLAAGSKLLLRHVGVNPTRTGIIEILNRMGADIELIKQTQAGNEPVSDIKVSSARLKGIDITPDLVPLAIDEFPAIFIAAACAEGRTVLSGAHELRIKESDRIQAMAEGLQTCGITANPTADGVVIEGGTITGGVIDSHGDHRIAMAFAIAGMMAQNPILIRDCDNVSTSFPDFAELASSVGLNISTGT
jgi:3-phosphoshikimate 1-carboxyvinyltransferase